MIVKETFTFYTETIKGAPRESPDSFWSRVSLTLTSAPGAWSIRDIALQGSVNTQYLCISSVTWRQIPSMPLLQDVRDFFPSAKFSHKVRLDSRVRSKGTALLHLFPKAVVPTGHVTARACYHELASERNAGILFEHFKGKLVMLGKMLSISSTIKKNAQKVCSSRVFFDRRPPLRR